MEKAVPRSSHTTLTPYDALNDKHASFYFNGQGVKKQLKKLKRAIEMEPHSKTYQSYAENISHKLQQLDRQSNTQKYQIRPYEQTLKPSSLNKLGRFRSFFEEHPNRPHQPKHNQLRKDLAERSEEHLPHLSKQKSGVKGATSNIKRQTIDPNRPQKTQTLIQSSSNQQTGAVIRKYGRFNLNRERSNKSVQLRVGMRKKEPEKNGGLKEVRHEDFVDFLKKRQQMIRKQVQTLQHTSQIPNSQVPIAVLK